MIPRKVYFVSRTNKFVPRNYGHLTERSEEYFDPTVVLLKESKKKNTLFDITFLSTHKFKRSLIEMQKKKYFPTKYYNIELFLKPARPTPVVMFERCVGFLISLNKTQRKESSTL